MIGGGPSAESESLEMEWMEKGSVEHSRGAAAGHDAAHVTRRPGGGQRVLLSAEGDDGPASHDVERQIRGIILAFAVQVHEGDARSSSLRAGWTPSRPEVR